MKANNKVILVTGGGSGMGRELVLNLLSKNAKVVAIDINPNSLEETVGLVGNKKACPPWKILDHQHDAYRYQQWAN